MQFQEQGHRKALQAESRLASRRDILKNSCSMCRKTLLATLAASRLQPHACKSWTSSLGTEAQREPGLQSTTICLPTPPPPKKYNHPHIALMRKNICFFEVGFLSKYSRVSNTPHSAPPPRPQTHPNFLFSERTQARQAVPTKPTGARRSTRLVLVAA